MRELSLFREYLVRLRQEKLQNGHKHALSATTSHGNVLPMVVCAHEAELVQRIMGALSELDQDSGEFTSKYLKG
jgi:hypothetical protein